MAVRWPAGAQSAGVVAGIKPAGGLDVGLIVCEEPVAWAGTFTRNAAAAAPVVWSRSLLGRPVRAVVVNSGNANACTGSEGAKTVDATTAAAAASVGSSADEILVASTGPIGIHLSADKVRAGIASARPHLSADVTDFATSILTTDTTTKSASARAGDATIVGVAKGAAMLAPNMATMLAFIVTDAAVASPALQDALSESVDRTFNCVSVDACESTNDSVLLMATGRASAPEDALFTKALHAVCHDLAEQIAKDAEGGTRLVRVRVAGAADEPHARDLGRAVAASALWRAAVNGADPNWGRVLAALGAADRALDVDSVHVSIGAETVFARGEPTGSLAAAAKEMAGDEFVLTCVVGPGDASAEILTADLSAEYVALNATGTS